MKLKHNTPATQPRSATITPEYQAEVDRATSKAMVAYERAQRRLAAAETRLTLAQEKRERAKSAAQRRLAEHKMAVAAELVELRREELLRVEALMKSAPASAEHRGVRGFRPVPQPGGTL